MRDVFDPPVRSGCLLWRLLPALALSAALWLVILIIAELTV